LGATIRPVRLAVTAQMAEELRAKEIQKSLQMSHDPRYEEMAHFKSNEPLRLDRILQTRGNSMSLYPEVWDYPEPVSSKAVSSNKKGTEPRRATLYRSSVAEQATMAGNARMLAEAEVSNFDRSTLEKFEGRINWEESFRSQLDRLLLDFELSEEPSCRLNHLERCHQWFMKEGKKQVRKETPAPSFLQNKEDGAAAPGSLRNIGPPSNNRTLNLATSTHMRRCPRIEQQMSVVPPPPPSGGYK